MFNFNRFYTRFVYIFVIKFETNKTMDKNRNKKQYNKYISVVIIRLKEKYGFSTQFIQQSLRGDRVSESSEKIKEDYKLFSKRN